MASGSNPSIQARQEGRQNTCNVFNILTWIPSTLFSGFPPPAWLRSASVRPPQGSWVSIQSSRGTELRWWKIERLAPARWKFHCRRLSQLTVYTWWRFIVMLQCTIFLGSPPISRDVLAGIFWRGKKFFVRIFFLQLFESEKLQMATECSKPGQNSMQSSWHSHCCWVKAKTLIWSPPTCSTGTWAQAPMAR